MQAQPGQRALGICIRDGADSVQPRIALWVDTANGFVLATTLINPWKSPDDGISETLEALLAAITQSPSSQSSAPGLGQPMLFGGLMAPGASAACRSGCGSTTRTSPRPWSPPSVRSA